MSFVLKKHDFGPLLRMTRAAPTDCRLSLLGTNTGKDLFTEVSRSRMNASDEGTVVSQQVKVTMV